MRTTVKFVGGDRVIRRLQALRVTVPAVLAKAMYEEMQIESTESQEKTPVDTGDLKRSHLVWAPVIVPGEISVKITVGNTAAPYALYVHEDEQAYHHVGTHHFLSKTLDESKRYLPKRIAKRADVADMVI